MTKRKEPTIIYSDPLQFGLWLDLALADIEAVGATGYCPEDAELAARWHAGEATSEDLRVFESHALMLLSECWTTAPEPVWN
jgi:hypothetical protein